MRRSDRLLVHVLALDWLSSRSRKVVTQVIVAFMVQWLSHVGRFNEAPLNIGAFKGLENIVLKLGSVIDSVRVLGHWVNSRTTESLVEPHD